MTGHNKKTNKKNFDYQELLEFLVTRINIEFHEFKNDSQIPKQHYELNKRLAILAMTNAVSDIERSASYHSDTGPTDYKIAGFSGKWVAHQRPIWIIEKRPINLHTIDLENINSDFATYFVQSLLDHQFYPKLGRDLSYCFEYRRTSGDDIAMLLEHSLVWSPNFHTKTKK